MPRKPTYQQREAEVFDLLRRALAHLSSPERVSSPFICIERSQHGSLDHKDFVAFAIERPRDHQHPNGTLVCGHWEETVLQALESLLCEAVKGLHEKANRHIVDHEDINSLLAKIPNKFKVQSD